MIGSFGSFRCEFVECPTNDSYSRMLCATCRSVAYCSKDCQNSDWKKHKLVCKELGRKREAIKWRKALPKMSEDAKIGEEMLAHFSESQTRTQSELERNKRRDLELVSSWKIGEELCGVMFGDGGGHISTSGKNSLRDERIATLESVLVLDQARSTDGIIPKGHLRIFFNGRGVDAPFYTEDIVRMMGSYKEQICEKIQSGVSLQRQMLQYQNDLRSLGNLLSSWSAPTYSSYYSFYYTKKGRKVSLVG